jgi:hypothetical protein
VVEEDDLILGCVLHVEDGVTTAVTGETRVLDEEYELEDHCPQLAS